MKRRSQELLNDYPEIVSKLLLLHESGLTIQNAFSVILKDYKSKNTAVSIDVLPNNKPFYCVASAILYTFLKRASPKCA